MSTHSEPRRWTLTGLQIVGKGRDYAGVLPSIEPDLEQDEVVSVREDKVTSADRERVAKELFYQAHPVERPGIPVDDGDGWELLSWDLISPTTQENWRLMADRVLVRIFKEGGET